jgi:surface antigen
LYLQTVPLRFIKTTLLSALNSDGEKTHMKNRFAAVLVAFSLTVGCAQQGGYGNNSYPTVDKQTGGALLGAVGGALAGSQFGKGKGQIATTAVGTLLGAFLGSQVGSSLDRADANYAQESANYAFNTGNAAQWNNPQSGAYGNITPVRTFETNNTFCREFQQTVTINGQAQRAFGTACKQPDGSWKIVQ